MKYQGVPLNDMIDFVLGEQAMMIKIKVLNWDSKIVNYLYTHGETKIAQQLLESKIKFMHNFEVLPYLKVIDI